MSKAKAQRPYRPLAGQLRAMIEQSGMNTNAVAVAVGIPQPVLHRFVTGDRENIRLDTADKLAEFFGVELRPARKPAKRNQNQNLNAKDYPCPIQPAFPFALGAPGVA